MQFIGGGSQQEYVERTRGLDPSRCLAAGVERGNLVGGLDRRHSNGSCDVVPTFVSKGGQTAHVEIECNISGV